MATTIVTKYGGDAPAASDIVRGELAVDTENGRLYTENAAGAVVEIGLNPEGNIDVTGSVTADGLTNNGDVVFSKSTTGVPIIKMSGFANANSPYGIINFYNEDGSQQGPNNAVQIKALAKNSDGSGGELAFYTSTGTGSEGADAVERLRIDSAGNVGIGTSSPSGAYAQPSLHIHATGTGAELHLTDGTTGATSSDGMSIFQYGNDGYIHMRENGSLRTYINGSERMRIDASGNVGIGTSLPAGLLNLHSASGDSNLFITTGNTAASTNIFFGDTDNSSVGRIVYDHGSNYMNFRTNGSDAARIDASGNLLVGKTAIGTNTAGFEARSTGFIGATRADVSAYFTRLTTDGDIVQFRKDGATVGSIGTQLSRLYIGSDDSMIFFDAGSTNAIWPWTSTATSSGDADNTIDIGDSSNRFKDLYLSGGVYLGGTGAANKLEDYEEGTWTPAYTGTTGGAVTYGTQTGSYTKVGNLVTVIGELRAKRDTLSGNVEITGLPFTNSGNGAGLSVNFASAFATDMPDLKGYTTSTKIALRKNATNTASGTPVANTDLADAATTENYLYFSATYLT